MQNEILEKFRNLMQYAVDMLDDQYMHDAKLAIRMALGELDSLYDCGAISFSEYQIIRDVFKNKICRTVGFE